MKRYPFFLKRYLSGITVPEKVIQADSVLDRFIEKAESISGRMVERKSISLHRDDDAVQAAKLERWQAGSEVKVISRRSLTPEETQPRCIKCGAVVNEGFCNTGKVLVEIRDLIREHNLPKSGRVIKPEGSKYRITVSSYTRGLLCDDCASDYSMATMTDKHGVSTDVPVVVVDAIERNKPGETREGFKSNKGFSKRISQADNSYNMRINRQAQKYYRDRT